MSPCICIDDSYSLFRTITGAHYWDPKITIDVKLGDKLWFEKFNNGVKLSKTNSIDQTFIVMTLEDFLLHFKELTEIRNDLIDKLI
jgi:hypothetical protein